MYIVFSQIYFGITQYKLEQGKKKLIEFLCYGLPYYAKKLETYVPKLPWLKFKHGQP
jgi:hypothetical protein